MSSGHNSQPWMTLEEHEGAAIEVAERPDEPIKIGGSRRSFLKVLGVSGAVSLASCQRRLVEHAVPLLIPVEEIVPGTPVHYASTCTGCTASCGLMVTVRDGRPIKLEGHPGHPLSRGGLCAVGQGEIRGLYDKGRLRAPTVAGTEASWADVDKHVVSKLDGVVKSGKQVYVLSHSVVSPTARRAIDLFAARFATRVAVRLVEYDAAMSNASATIEAYKLLDGQAVNPSLSIDRSDLLISLGADLFGAGSEPVTHTRQYADRRRARDGGRDFRHVQIESNVTVTGASADERICASSSERRAVAWALLQQVAARGSGRGAATAMFLASKAPPQSSLQRETKALADALLKYRGSSLVVSGSADVSEQLAVALINRVLGNEGRTLHPDNPSHVRQGRNAVMVDFLQAMDAGSVGAVIVLGPNPVEELPGGEALKAQLSALPLAVAITDRPTATAAACGVVAAAHHGLERWGDAAPRPDVLTIVQPTVSPLFSTRDPMENLLRWAGDARSYREFLQQSWYKHAFDESPVASKSWTEAVSAGVVSEAVARRAIPKRGAATAPAADAELATRAQSAAANAELEVELLAEVALRDGLNSFNPWMRELPDPITRGAWLGTVRIAPALAKARGIRDGDVVTVDVDKVQLKLPARVLPGQHEHVLGVPVGYGLIDGDGGAAERNAYRAVTSTFHRSGLKATLTKTTEHTELPLMQVHMSSEGRAIIHEVDSDATKVPAAHHGPLKSLWTDRKYSPHWHMVVDLDACTGCSACVVSCQAENNTPVVGPDEMRLHRDMYWMRIDRYFNGSPEDPQMLFEPMLCPQCDNAPCETVCPVLATIHSADGLNQQAYNRCVGTRYCANNCPYKVRRFNWFDNMPTNPIERLVLNPDVAVRERGIMEKCTFCVQRIQLSRIEAKKEGREAFEVQTACQQSCPAQAISFGDVTIKDGPIDKLRHKPRAFQVLAELGIQPSLTYLAKVRRKGSQEA